MSTSPETSAWPLICPVCEAVLSHTGHALRCTNGHSFDIAKEGYVNLLLSRGRRGVAGDAPAMVKARRSFLSAGFYSALSDLLTAA